MHKGRKTGKTHASETTAKGQLSLGFSTFRSNSNGNSIENVSEQHIESIWSGLISENRRASVYLLSEMPVAVLIA